MAEKNFQKAIKYDSRNGLYSINYAVSQAKSKQYQLAAQTMERGKLQLQSSDAPLTHSQKHIVDTKMEQFEYCMKRAQNGYATN